jgi:hypothetical protein
MVDLERRVCQELVAGAIGTVEAGWIAVDEAADERTHAVRVLQREFGVGEQVLHGLDRIRPRRSRLHGEPLVEDERLVLPAVIEIGEHLVACFEVGEDGERGDGVGHVRRLAIVTAHGRSRSAAVPAEDRALRCATPAAPLSASGEKVIMAAAS